MAGLQTIYMGSKSEGEGEGPGTVATAPPRVGGIRGGGGGSPPEKGRNILAQSPLLLFPSGLWMADGPAWWALDGGWSSLVGSGRSLPFLDGLWMISVLLFPGGLWIETVLSCAQKEPFDEREGFQNLCT